MGYYRAFLESRFIFYRYFSQPDCDIGWDSSCDCYYHDNDLYMLADSQSDLPVFPHFCCASKHDSHGFLPAISTRNNPLQLINIKLLCICPKNLIPAFQAYHLNRINKRMILKTLKRINYNRFIVHIYKLLWNVLSHSVPRSSGNSYCSIHSPLSEHNSRVVNLLVL